ncbi:MAG: SUMF1/EgtB/PvdO family nonheme iron enzyme, partial [Actinobacteria bacterium]|nr:SUMF1/EgtB/PvdO family nonheme iron enzyme [Actinomycetota bacterium]
MSIINRAGIMLAMAAFGWQVALANTYLVIDVSGGPSASSYPVSMLSAVPGGGWTDDYKTAKIVLRKIPAGTFIMGSPEGEFGRDPDETQHQATLTEDFYIGVFPVTQRQWERVMGDWPSFFNNTAYRDSRPVERVTYYEIRENPNNSSISPNWPQSSQVHVDSFMGKLRDKTGLATLDLPTESQWEYACRAGTATALNSGYNLTNTVADVRMDEVGRYWYNGGSGYSSSCDPNAGSATVGSYLANQWGLYDMHGNVWEWCLDWEGAYPATVTDPVGAASGSDRVLRGGSWFDNARYCRSAYRGNDTPSHRYAYYGFRLARTLQPHTLTVVSGTGGGEYAVGTAVAVTADEPPAGQVFDYWTVDPSDADLGVSFDPTLSSTTATMPAHPVTLTANYAAIGTVTTPVFSPDGGKHAGSNLHVTITCSTDGATIRYTTNGNDPTELSPGVLSGGTAPVPVPGTLKAKAFKSGMNPSATKSASYTAAASVATPTYNPDGGEHA